MTDLHQPVPVEFARLTGLAPDIDPYLLLDIAVMLGRDDGAEPLWAASDALIEAMHELDARGCETAARQLHDVGRVVAREAMRRTPATG